jgi:hypothetical protein
MRVSENNPSRQLVNRGCPIQTTVLPCPLFLGNDDTEMTTPNNNPRPSNDEPSNEISIPRVPIISFAVFVAALYSFGFLALLVPIYRYHDAPSWKTALQAVSEVSRTVVIVQGIIGFGLPVLFFGVSLLGMIYITLVSLQRVLSFRPTPTNELTSIAEVIKRAWRRDLPQRWLWLRRAWFIAALLFLIGFTVFLPGFLAPPHDLLEPHGGIKLVVVGLMSGWVALTAAWFGLKAFNSREQVKQKKFLKVGVVLAILAAALCASPRVVLVSEPPLPYVSVVATEGSDAVEASNNAAIEGNTTEQHQTTDTGFLLGHSDGSWHILTRDGITAVPNGKVIRAEVS